MDGTTLAAAGIGGVIASVVAALALAIRQVLNTRSQIDRRRRKEESDQDTRANERRREDLDDYIKRLQKDLQEEREQRRQLAQEFQEQIEEERKRTEECRKEHLRSEQFRAEIQGWAGVVEQILARHRIKIPKFPRDPNQGPGSGIYRALQDKENDDDSGDG